VLLRLRVIAASGTRPLAFAWGGLQDRQKRWLLSKLTATRKTVAFTIHWQTPLYLDGVTNVRMQGVVQCSRDGDIEVIAGLYQREVSQPVKLDPVEQV
jgi:hypothetical protein